MKDISIRNIRKLAKQYLKTEKNKQRALELAWNDEMQRLFKLGKFSSKSWHEIIRGDRPPKWINVWDLKLDVNSGKIKKR